MKRMARLIWGPLSICAAAVSASAQSVETTEQAEFEQLFRSWDKASARSRPPTRPRPAPPNHSADSVRRTIISSPMGMRINPVTGRRMLHSGADIAAPLGMGVRATADGLVMRAGPLGSYGLLVTIRHADGYETRYGHLSRVLVRPGAAIRKGDLVGQVGSTGRSTGPHLHYEIRHLGRVIDPVPSMARRD